MDISICIFGYAIFTLFGYVLIVVFGVLFRLVFSLYGTILFIVFLGLLAIVFEHKQKATKNRVPNIRYAVFMLCATMPRRCLGVCFQVIVYHRPKPFCVSVPHKAVVGSDHSVFHIPQGMIRGQRLFLENVQNRKDFFVSQGV